MHNLRVYIPYFESDLQELPSFLERTWRTMFFVDVGEHDPGDGQRILELDRPPRVGLVITASYNNNNNNN